MILIVFMALLFFSVSMQVKAGAFDVQFRYITARSFQAYITNLPDDAAAVGTDSESIQSHCGAIVNNSCSPNFIDGRVHGAVPTTVIGPHETYTLRFNAQKITGTTISCHSWRTYCTEENTYAALGLSDPVTVTTGAYDVRAIVNMHEVFANGFTIHFSNMGNADKVEVTLKEPGGLLSSYKQSCTRSGSGCQVKFQSGLADDDGMTMSIKPETQYSFRAEVFKSGQRVQEAVMMYEVKEYRHDGQRHIQRVVASQYYWNPDHPIKTRKPMIKRASRTSTAQKSTLRLEFAEIPLQYPLHINGGQLNSANGEYYLEIHIPDIDMGEVCSLVPNGGTDGHGDPIKVWNCAPTTKNLHKSFYRPAPMAVEKGWHEFSGSFELDRSLSYTIVLKLWKGRSPGGHGQTPTSLGATLLASDSVTLPANKDIDSSNRKLSSSITVLTPVPTAVPELKMRVTSVTGNTISIAWDAFPGATGYSVKVVGGGKTTTIPVDKSKTSIIITNLRVRSGYSVKLTVLYNGGSKTANATAKTKDNPDPIPTATAVPAPVLRVASVTSDSININWDAYPGATLYGIDVTGDGKTTSSSVASSKTSAIISNLEADTAYTITLKVVFNGGTASAQVATRTALAESGNIENLGNTPVPTPNPYAALIQTLLTYQAETGAGADHVERWTRALAALGHGTHNDPVTVSEAQGYVDQGWARWVPVLAALKALDPPVVIEDESETTSNKDEVTATAVPPSPTNTAVPLPTNTPVPLPNANATLIQTLLSYQAETEGGADHVERWTRALAALGHGSHNDPVTISEVEGYVGQGWVRWVPVLAALKALNPPPPDTPVPPPTNTPVPLPTNTPVPLPSNTAVPPPTNTPVPLPSNTPVPPPTNTPVPLPSNTPVPLPTDTPVPLPTDTPVPPPTNTPAPPPPDTPVPPPTNTSVPPPTPETMSNKLKVSFSNITSDGFTVSWSKLAGSVEYFLSVYDNGANVNIFKQGWEDRYENISGLSADTEYTVMLDGYQTSNGESIDIVTTTVRTSA